MIILHFLTFDLLCKMHPLVNFHSNDHIVYWAAITGGHFLLLHAGEFTLCPNEHFNPSCNLALGDITSHLSLDGQHYSMVHVKRSKTDQRHQGVTLYISHSNHSFCPACAMNSNLALQWSRPTLSERSPLFLLQKNQALTRQRVVTFVSYLVRLFGVDRTAFCGHSFRIGGVSSASLAGLAVYEIQMLGCWKTDCYKTYINSPLNALLQFPQCIAKTASITYQYANPYYYQNNQNA